MTDADLKQLALRSGAVTMGAQLVRLVLAFGSTMILARMLTPGDFGVVAMVASVTGIVGIVLDGGLSAATVQRKDSTHAHFSALFWVNAVMGLILGALCAALAPAIVWFYDDPRLHEVTLISALALVVSGLGIQHAALLVRDLRARELAAIDVGAVLVGIVVAIVLAGSGHGYRALAWMPAAQALARLVGLVAAVRWLPEFSLASGTVWQDLSFGARITGASIMDYLARSLDNVLIGRAWGDAALGGYYRAYSLLMLPLRQVLTPMTSVVFPTLSRLQLEPARFRRYYLQSLFLMTVLTTPLCLGLGVLAEEAVYVLLGPQWRDSAPIFRLLSVAAAIQPVTGTVWWLYPATGRGGAMLRRGGLGSAVFILSFLIGLPWGPVGVATAYATANLLWFLPCMKFAIEGTSVTLPDMLRAVRIPFLASLPGLAWVMAVRALLGDSLPLLAWLPLAVGGMIAIYGFFLASVFGKKDELLDMLGQLRAPTARA